MIRAILRHWREAPVECVAEVLSLGCLFAGLWLLLQLVPGIDAAIIAWRAGA